MSAVVQCPNCGSDRPADSYCLATPECADGARVHAALERRKIDAPRRFLAAGFGRVLSSRGRPQA